jgi:hypothetical protein
MSQIFIFIYYPFCWTLQKNSCFECDAVGSLFLQLRVSASRATFLSRIKVSSFSFLSAWKITSQIDDKSRTSRCKCNCISRTAKAVCRITVELPVDSLIWIHSCLIILRWNFSTQSNFCNLEYCSRYCYKNLFPYNEAALTVLHSVIPLIRNRKTKQNKMNLKNLFSHSSCNLFRKMLHLWNIHVVQANGYF